MIQITPQMRIFVAVEPVDFRKGIDGLVCLCRDSLKFDPFSGSVFVFRSRRATAIKLLVYDGRGFWLCQKRLSVGHFRYWPRRMGKAASELESHELAVLIAGGDPGGVQGSPIWKRVQVVV